MLCLSQPCISRPCHEGASAAFGSVTVQMGKSLHWYMKLYLQSFAMRCTLQISIIIAYISTLECIFQTYAQL